MASNRPPPRGGLTRRLRVEYSPTSADEELSRRVRDIARRYRERLSTVSSFLLDVAEARYGVEDATGRMIEFFNDHQDYRYADAIESVLNHMTRKGYVVERAATTAFHARRESTRRSVILLTLTEGGASLIAYELKHALRPPAAN
jgi:hypothetical protein